MGQQQLLLLVAGVVIVGLAVMGGFYAAEEALKRNAADVIVGRSLSIATDAVYWKAKNDPFVGGNATYDGLEAGGMAKLFIGEETEDGVFQITRAEGTDLEITAVSKRYPEIGVRVTVANNEIVNTTINYGGAISIP